MIRPKDVDSYILSAPQEVRERLQQIRDVIRSTVPTALEKISYGMPYYSYKGRLVYFAYFKHHIGVYLTPPIIEEFRDELASFGTSTATIRFPHEEKLPLPLIKKLVKARATLNEQNEAKLGNIGKS